MRDVPHLTDVSLTGMVVEIDRERLGAESGTPSFADEDKTLIPFSTNFQSRTEEYQFANARSVRQMATTSSQPPHTHPFPASALHREHVPFPFRCGLLNARVRSCHCQPKPWYGYSSLADGALPPEPPLVARVTSAASRKLR